MPTEEVETKEMEEEEEAEEEEREGWKEVLKEEAVWLQVQERL